MATPFSKNNLKKIFRFGNSFYYKKSDGTYSKIKTQNNNASNPYEKDDLIYYKEQNNKYLTKKKNNIKNNLLDSCSICHAEFNSKNNKSRIISLPCGHVFHQACIQSWYETSRTCPVCRKVYNNNPSIYQNILGRPEIVKSSIVYSVAYSPDGKYIASGTRDTSVRVWNADPTSDKYCDCLKTLNGHSGWVQSVAYSPDGKYIASGSWDNSVKVWDADANSASYGTCMKTLNGHSDWVASVAYSPDGRNIASGSVDKSVRVWDADPKSDKYGTCMKTLNGHSRRVISVAYSSDGRNIASGSQGKCVRVWDAKSGTCLKTFMARSEGVLSVAYSPDGRHIALGLANKTVEVWEFNKYKQNVFTMLFRFFDTYKCIKTLIGHTHFVSSVAYSPDGQYIASGSGDKSVRVWDVESGACLTNVKMHWDSVFSVSYRPDGKYIASGSADKRILTLDVSSLSPKVGGKKSKTTKKEKLIDTYKKSNLIKIAKKHEISLKTKDKTPKTKLQLFNSLKRKKLVH
jgi:WD40 repeat protein